MMWKLFITHVIVTVICTVVTILPWSEQWVVIFSHWIDKGIWVVLVTAEFIRHYWQKK